MKPVSCLGIEWSGARCTPPSGGVRIETLRHSDLATQEVPLHPALGRGED